MKSQKIFLGSIIAVAIIILIVFIISVISSKSKNNNVAVNNFEAQLAQVDLNIIDEEYLELESDPILESEFVRGLVLGASTSRVVKLYPGIQGEELLVTQLQQILSELGFYDGAFDGKYGPGTKSAVASFQSEYGLKDDGIVGAETGAKMIEVYTTGKGTVTKDNSGDRTDQLKVVTLPASNLLPDSAQLNGYVYSGTATEAWFIWGRSARNLSCGPARSQVDAGTNFIAGDDFSGILGGLTPNTLYYYLSCGIDALTGDMVSGTKKVFTTPAQEDVEFKIRSNDDPINEAHIIGVDVTQPTDDVKVFSFGVEVDGDADIILDNLSVETFVRGAVFADDLFDQAHLYIDGTKIDTIVTPVNENTLVFNDMDYEMESDPTYEYTFEIFVDMLPMSSTLDTGDELAFRISEVETDIGATIINATTGAELYDSDITGTVESEYSAVYDTYIDVEFVSSDSEVLVLDGDDNDTIVFTHIMDIEAVGGTIFIADSAAPTTASGDSLQTVGPDGFLYLVYRNGVATVDTADVLDCDLSNSNVSDSSNNIRVDEGGQTRCRLTFTHTNVEMDDDGYYGAKLIGIGWSIADDDIHEFLYDYNMEEYDIPPSYVN